MATVNLDKSEYDSLVASVELARQETAAVKVELETERARTVDDKLTAATMYIEASKAVIDYAVGNLSPEFSLNWPSPALRVLADQVAIVGHATQRDRERAEIWNAFCADIAKYERERQARGATAIDDIDDPAIKKMHADIARGLAGGVLVQNMSPKKPETWATVIIVVMLCATLILIARMFLAS